MTFSGCWVLLVASADLPAFSGNASMGNAFAMLDGKASVVTTVLGVGSSMVNPASSPTVMETILTEPPARG